MNIVEKLDLAIKQNEKRTTDHIRIAYFTKPLI